MLSCDAYIFLWKPWFIPVIKAKISASLLQSFVSHDPSEITLMYWFAVQETFITIIIIIIIIIINI